MKSGSSIQTSTIVKKHYPLMSLTTIRVGGHASYFAPVSTIHQLLEVITFSRENELPFYILGNGSNVLIDDEDFNGVVIKMDGDFKSISFDYSNQSVTAGAGASLMKLGNKLAEQGYLGCAYMAVIPGTVGGAVRMNAGIKKQGAIKDNFLSALVLDPETCEIQEYAKNAMAFDYRKSVISKSKKIIIETTFTLPQNKEKHDSEALNTVKELLETRRSRHPKNPHTFGSAFKNPQNSKHSAGWYLEKAGMKGMRIGGAMVAREHANWVLNVDNTRSSDVKKLIEIGQKRAYEQFGIQLEREVIYLPEDMEEWK
jgi:UDP-N-acetylmuramate dehydrogenase